MLRELKITLEAVEGGGGGMDGSGHLVKIDVPIFFPVIPGG